jgi:hypothetical protein
MQPETWAVWQAGKYTAHVRVLYAHPNCHDVYRIEGAHGQSYALGSELRFTTDEKEAA